MSDEIRIRIIKSSFEQGMRAGDFKPDDQIAPWVIEGLRAMEEGKFDEFDLDTIDRAGGTDHPDPWVT